MKHFHGVLAGNAHECSLILRIGKASRPDEEGIETSTALMQPAGC
jgi:hypothetical protein